MTDVSVPQKDGEIVLQTNGDVAVVLPVTKGRVSAEGAVLDVLLANVPGAKVAEAAPVKPSA